jgi:DTW domain-containing protein YfiP
MSNSARLLDLWLPHTQRIVRGAPPTDTASLPAPTLAGIDHQHAVLLFPDERATGETPPDEPAPLRVPTTTGLMGPLPGFEIRHLVVPDGTWAQARRIVRRELLPLGLPRLALDRAWPSIYELRRRPIGLCTFEAIAVALGLLESAALAAGLLERFAHWSQRQMQVKLGSPATPSFGAPEPHPALARLREITG